MNFTFLIISSLSEHLSELLVFQVHLEGLLWILEGESAVGLKRRDEVLLELHDVPALSGQVLFGGLGRGEVHGDLAELVSSEERCCLGV